MNFSQDSFHNEKRYFSHSYPSILLNFSTKYQSSNVKLPSQNTCNVIGDQGVSKCKNSSFHMEKEITCVGWGGRMTSYELFYAFSNSLLFANYNILQILLCCGNTFYKTNGLLYLEQGHVNFKTWQQKYYGRYFNVCNTDNTL